ncbi:FCD domain-containing protein [Marinobacter halodurans]|uniref:FCD domain-containing protein n=1 Tax=Marinobacter halodurans TaxID=2528979 RepID=A0ABY1ZG73_9GAMM|nr:FCD domain-containing protein [Marinobacter halodurans]TBW48318.1 FCD domain-containing protein [Marinobacter halodurans]
MQNTQERSLIEVAFQQMKKAIIYGELAPGEKLKVASLSKSYGLSSSPIREALNRLSQEGVVVASDNRGFRVAALSVDDFEQITRLRCLLECEALADAIEQGDDDWEANVIGAFHRLCLAEKKLAGRSVALDNDWTERHRAFHFALFSACTSDRLLRIIDSLFDQAERYRRYSALNRTSVRNKSDEHRRLMDVALERDGKAAVELLEQHIKGTLKSVTAALRLQENATLQ